MLVSTRPKRARREVRIAAARPRTIRCVRPNWLQWPTRPKIQRTENFGMRRRWLSRCGNYRVDFYVDGGREFKAFFLGHELPISNHAKLRSAKAACQAHARKRGAS